MFPWRTLTKKPEKEGRFETLQPALYNGRYLVAIIGTRTNNSSLRRISSPRQYIPEIMNNVTLRRNIPIISSRVRFRPLSRMNHSKTVYPRPANPQKSAKVFGSCRLVLRRFPASGSSDLSDMQWNSPSGFDMVDLLRISEKHEGFHASRGGCFLQTAGLSPRVHRRRRC